uniref:Uncharacterized protein n=1 Tax=viral metagenome TaxID=1070528 RepID=A0A6H1ZAI7_9ZZZZ
MSFDVEGNKICDWCYKLISKSEDIDKDDPFYSPLTKSKCFECVSKATPIKKNGRIKDLPDDFWCIGDSIKKFLDGESLTKEDEEYLSKILVFGR